MGIAMNGFKSSTLTCLAVSSVACLAVSSPARAGLVIFDTFSNSADSPAQTLDSIFGSGDPVSGLTKSGTSFEFRDSGIQVTFSDPQEFSTDRVSRTNSTLGICLGGNRLASVAVCGNSPSSQPQLNKIALKFNKAVELVSTSGVMRSVAGDNQGDARISSIWETVGSSATFSYSNPPSNIGNPFYTNPYSSTFSKFIVAANTPLTVTTNFQTGEYVDYWMQNLQVQAVEASVPAPLPLLGAGSAFAFTRRIRRRINAARPKELV
jgi:hypothetical protein